MLDYSPEAQRQLLADHQDPEVTAGLFQGDMAGLTTEVRSHLVVVVISYTPC